MGTTVHKKCRPACDNIPSMFLQKLCASIACCRPKPVFPEVLQTLSVDVKRSQIEMDANSQCAVSLVLGIVVWDYSVHNLRYVL